MSPLQHDALMKIFSLGAGHAAASMSRIVTDEVLISARSVALLPHIEAALPMSSNERRRLCAITQKFSGIFNTEAILLFREFQARDIVRLMTGQAQATEAPSDLEQEAISEIGNIILNACMGALAIATSRPLAGSLPACHIGAGHNLLAEAGAGNGNSVLTLKFTFVIERCQADGEILFLLDPAALVDLRACLNLYLARMAT